MDVFCKITSLNRGDLGKCHKKVVTFVNDNGDPPLEERFDMILNECPEVSGSCDYDLRTYSLE
jgi:hypothetical protein